MSYHHLLVGLCVRYSKEEVRKAVILDPEHSQTGAFMQIPFPVLQTPTHMWSQKHPVPLLSFTHFTICSIWAIWLPSLGQAECFLWVIVLCWDLRVCGGRTPLPAGGHDDRRSLWKERDLRGPGEAGLKIQTWQHHCPGRPQFLWLCARSQLFSADFIPRVLRGPWLGTGQKAMAGWRKARPWRGGGQLEHSTEMGSAFKLHTVAQWTGESTDKMDPNQPRLPSRDQPSVRVQVWTETYLWKEQKTKAMLRVGTSGWVLAVRAKRRAAIWKNRTMMGWESGWEDHEGSVCRALEDVTFSSPISRLTSSELGGDERKDGKMRSKVPTLWIASSCSRSRQSRVCPSPSCMRSIGSLWGRPWNERWGGGYERREKASRFLVLHLSAATPPDPLLYKDSRLLRFLMLHPFSWPQFTKSVSWNSK